MRLLISLLFLNWATLLAAAEQQPAGVDQLAVAKRQFEQGNFDAALATLEAIEQRGGPAALALDLRGCIYLEQKKYEEAIKAFTASIAQEKNLYVARLHLGDALLRQGKWSEAREAYESLMRDSNILMINERLRFAAFLTYLGAKDDRGASEALARVMFPTETAAYYYAQAAWAFAQGSKRAGEKWLRTADEIFDEKKTAWFARPLYDFGWIKTKPPLVAE